MSLCRACAVYEYDVTDGVQYVETPEATLFDGHYLRNRSTFNIGVLGYIGIVQHKEHSPGFVHSSWDTLYLCIKLVIDSNLCSFSSHGLYFVVYHRLAEGNEFSHFLLFLLYIKLSIIYFSFFTFPSRNSLI